MPPDDMLFGVDRLVVYLPAAVESLSNIDGSRENKIRKEAEKFLSSPPSAFDKHPTEHIGQIKHRASKTRGFATWCQNEVVSVELCVVHEIYRKKNEGDYWRDIDEYESEGREFASKFKQLDPTTFSQWKKKVKDDRSTILVTS